MDASSKGSYYTILGRYILTALGFNIKLSEHVNKVDDVPLKISSAPMVDSGTYEYQYLNTGEITPKELFMNSYVEEIYKSEQFRTYTKLLCTVLYTKYENSYLNKVMKINEKT